MEIISRELADVLGKVYLGGLIKELVIRSDEQGITIAAVDIPDTMYCQVHSTLSLGNREVGVGDLQLLIKYLMGNENTIDIVVQDNRLVCTKGDVNFKYLLTDPRIVATSPQELPENGLAQVTGLPFRLELTEALQEDYKRMAALIKPRAVTVTMGSRGRVLFNAGAESSHQFTSIGGIVTTEETTPYPDISVRVLGDYLSAVFGVLSKAHKAYMYLPPDGACVAIQQEADFWILKPIVGGTDV